MSRYNIYEDEYDRRYLYRSDPPPSFLSDYDRWSLLNDELNKREQQHKRDMENFNSSLVAFGSLTLSGILLLLLVT